MRRRDIHIGFRVTEEEYRKIKAKVRESGLSQREYLVLAALAQKIVNTDPLREILPEMKRQGDNLNQIADGESQVSIAISSNCWQSFNGTDSFEGRANPDLRVIAGLYLNPNQVVVTERSGIKTLADVRGKHFAVAASGSSVEGECKNHFTAAGLNYPDDIRAEYISFSDSAELLRNGQIDGAWIMSGIPASAVSQTLSSGCRLLAAQQTPRHVEAVG